MILLKLKQKAENMRGKHKNPKSPPALLCEALRAGKLFQIIPNKYQMSNVKCQFNIKFQMSKFLSFEF